MLKAWIATFVLFSSLSAVALEKNYLGNPNPVWRPWLKSGLVTTVQGPRLTEYEKANATSYQVGSKKFSNGSLSVEYRYAHYIKDRSFPTLVLQNGLLGDLEGRFTQFSMSFFKDNFDFNVVVLETLTSPTSVKRNRYFNLGSLHDSFQTLDALKYLMSEEVIDSKQVVLLGGSASTFGLFHAPPLLEKNGFTVIGTVLVAAYDDMTPVLGMICRYSKKRKDRNECGEEAKLIPRIVRAAGKKAMMGLSKTLFKDEDFAAQYTDYLHDRNYVGLFDIMVESFEAQKESLEYMYQAIYSTPIVFNDIFDFYKKIRLIPHLEENTAPLLWLSADDDPIARFKEQSLPMIEASKDHENLYTYIVRNGGHAGYTRAYGKKWLKELLTEFFAEL